MRITGRKLITGPVVGTPSRSPNQPHWKTATTAPNEAATDSRKPSAALTGTRIERKTSSSRTRASPTTTSANGSSASAEPVGDVDRDRGLAGDREVGAGLLLQAGAARRSRRARWSPPPAARSRG